MRRGVGHGLPSGFWPTRHTPLEVMQAGVHNRDERIHVDDVGYAARFLLPRRAQPSWADLRCGAASGGP